jgi:hypothetical protein
VDVSWTWEIIRGNTKGTDTVIWRRVLEIILKNRPNCNVWRIQVKHAETMRTS